MDQAKIVQHLLLPTRLPETSQLKFASLFIPMEEIGGDFFDVIKLSDHHYGLLIADVTGHGIPAALLTFMLSTIFKNAATGVFSTAEAVRLTNERLYHKMPGDAFVTMFYAIYNTSTGKLTYTQAGHPEAYLLRQKTGEIISLESEGTLVGAFSNEEIRFSQNEIQLFPGDKLILYTDAILDTFDHFVDDHIESDIKSYLLKNRDFPLNELFTNIYEYGLSIGNLENYHDDFTMLGMEIAG